MILMFIASMLMGLLLASLLHHKKSKQTLKDKHVVISGGSSGIGLELARGAFKAGARVTLVARNEERLKQSIETFGETPVRIGYVSVNLSSDIYAIEKAMRPAIEARGDVDVLINCAGSAVASYVDDTSEQMYRQMMDTNFYSAVNLTKACLVSLEKQCVAKGVASVVFVSSVAGLMGIFGYSAYSPSKFALVGFAQTLLAEKQDLGLHVMVAFPPDTETPGYANENVGKPLETVAISNLGGLQKPAAVAAGILDDICKLRVSSSFGLDGQLLFTAASGLWPVGSIWKLLSEVALIAPGRLLGVYLHWAFARCVRTARRQPAAGDRSATISE